MSIHHLQLWVPDLERAEQSWGWLLEQLGYTLTHRFEHGCVWRDANTAIVVEASPDMVPGMLHSRLRPGMNHVAFNVDSAEAIAAIVAASAEHGWTPLGGEPRHPLAPAHTAAYLEDADGFEVELIAVTPAD